LITGATLGAIGATALWLATSMALFFYVQRLGTYESTYGSLAGVAISMFWLWISVLLVVAGAAVNGEAERQRARDSTVGVGTTHGGARCRGSRQRSVNRGRVLITANPLSRCAGYANANRGQASAARTRGAEIRTRLDIRTGGTSSHFVWASELRGTRWLLTSSRT
jgi:Virulence factor BrkB